MMLSRCSGNSSLMAAAAAVTTRVGQKRTRTIIIQKSGGPRGRALTTTTTTTSAAAAAEGAAPRQQPVRVVSRRAYEAYKATLPKPPPEPKKKDVVTPWPRSLQIAGYVMAAIGIPYSVAWYIASNHDLRVFLAKYIPNLEETLRHVFGHVEPDSVSYYDLRTGKEQPHYILDDECPYTVRAQQDKIDELVETSEVPVRISLVSDDHMSTSREIMAKGSTLARPDALLEIIGEGKLQDENVTVAVDFGDLEEEKEASSSTTTTELADALSSFDTAASSTATVIPKQCVSYSTWYHQPNIVVQQQQQQQRLSRDEVEETRLKWEIEQLEADLRDVNCNRDVDDMQRELREYKAELRKLTWKRRLRLGGGN